MIDGSNRILDKLNIKIKPNSKVFDLSVGEQQMVEIAKALNCEANILIMDEPTAALTESETDELFRVIKDLKKNRVGVIYISHRMEELKKIADTVLVMRDGKFVDKKLFSETTIDEIIKFMVGRELKDQFPKRNVELGEEIYELNFEEEKSPIKNFSLRKGEVLGFSGLMGAGRTELGKTIFGASNYFKIKTKLENKELSINSPVDAIKNGIIYLTEDRKKNGLLLNLTVEDNIMVSNLNIIKSKFGNLSFKKSKNIVEDYISKLSIKTPSKDQEIKNLSGGNQQKAILARWLIQNKKILIIDEPTRGIDVGAKREIYILVNKLAEEGVSIIMISSELPEIIGMCDRVLVMHEGKINGILENKNLTQEKIMAYATGKEYHKFGGTSHETNL
ncbi:MAG: sugar ABC transporter ATP-binding protein, partial [Fusobacteriaceae bacterium]